MDTVTQMVLGAAVGQVVAHRRLGAAALTLGAVGGLLPDLDVAASWLGPFAEWRYHRGITHSVFFGPVVGPVLGYAAWRAYRRWRPRSLCAGPAALGPIVAVLVMALVTHPLLDLFTVYGTQLLAPFSDVRFSWPGVPIIDPAYTIVLLAALLVGMARPKGSAAPVVAAAIALTLSSAYLLYGLSQNLRAESEARRQLAQDGVLAADIRATPTMFQPWLRRVVVQEESGLRVGFVSTWAPSGIAWTCLPRLRDQAVAAAMAAPQAQLFAWFADGQLWPALRRDDQGRTVVRLTDLRYGFPGPTLVGWWGLDVTLDAEGRAVGAQRFRIARGASTAAIAALYAAAFGDVARLSAVGGGEVPAATACR